MAELPDWVWASPQALPPKPSYSDDRHPNRRKDDEPGRESHVSQD
jgi:hypothetical protein